LAAAIGLCGESSFQPSHRARAPHALHYASRATARRLLFFNAGQADPPGQRGDGPWLGAIGQVSKKCVKEREDEYGKQRACRRVGAGRCECCAAGSLTRRGLTRDAPDPAHWPVIYRKVVEMWRTQPHYTISDLSHIEAPTLVIAGESDLVRRDHTDQLAKAIPKSQEFIVQGAGHSVPYEKSAIVNSAILQFLADSDNSSPILGNISGTMS
jgi:pimeloyl-ACP methyl ester carboxylesterase